MEEEKVRSIVRSIAVLYYIGGGFSLLLSSLLFVGSSWIASLFHSFVPFLSQTLIIIAAAVIGLSGIISIFVGMGLWKKQDWARIVAIVFAVFGIIFSGYSIFRGRIFNNIVSLGFSIYVIVFLMFNNDVKSYFKSS